MRSYIHRSFATKNPITFLANVDVNSRSRSHILSPVRLSSVYNARAPYSGGCNLRQYFNGIWYFGHPLISTKNFTEIVPGEPSVGGVKHKRGTKYSDFGPIEGYI